MLNNNTTCEKSSNFNYTMCCEMSSIYALGCKKKKEKKKKRRAKERKGRGDRYFIITQYNPKKKASW